MRLSDDPVRRLTAVDLGLATSESPSDEHIPDLGIGDDDALLETTLDLIETYGGVIFVGPPGTSKTWYAANIALKLAKGNEELVRFVQFHPSYQYEDFVEGFVPTDDGFKLHPKHLVQLCKLAEDRPNDWVVLVIDELSRGEPGRIFGEALTYVEKTKRGLEFSLASGTVLSIPANLVILATMNLFDRGVDEVDAAFERRFAKIAMEPSTSILRALLEQAGMADDLRRRVATFFEAALRRARSNPFATIGHTFFLDVSDEAGLRRLWEYQLRFVFEKAYQLDPQGWEEINQLWERIFEMQPAIPESAEARTEATPDEPAQGPGPETASGET